MSTNITAAIIIIGNEILSGKTLDKNTQYIATELMNLGIRLREARVIPDVESDIIKTVNELREKHNYVFTTGGIGPTHDDITSACVAKAFGAKLVRNQEAVDALANYYGSKEELTEARLKMTEVPVGATLIPNKVTSAPGYLMENVFVLAGIPKIMQAMFEACKPFLKGGAIMTVKELVLYTSESKIAGKLTDIQNKYNKVEIGSYPFNDDRGYGVKLIFTGENSDDVDNALNESKTLIEE